jgi:pyrroloquinoline quinone biosynthesis protein B
LYWQGDTRVQRRTQSSIAVSADLSNWVLVNCSPDIREQIASVKVLHPQHGIRHSPIRAIVLTNGDIDHIGGLLSLREQQGFTIWASAAVLAQINDNPVFGVLNRSLVRFETLQPNVSFSPVVGLDMQTFDVPGKVPLYREGLDIPEVSRNGNTLGLHVRHTGSTLSYVPGCGAIDRQLLADLEHSDALLFDGTLWSDDEMITSETGVKTGRRMGHAPVSGDDGSIAQLASLRIQRKYLVHLNNTNPLLIDGSAERQVAEAHGWTVAHDGLEIVL